MFQNVILSNKLVIKYYKNKLATASQKQPLHLPWLFSWYSSRLAVSHSAVALRICDLFYFVFRGVKVIYLHISPFYSSLVILVFLTLSNNMKRITSFMCFSSFIASVSLNTDLLPSYLQLFLDCFTCVFPILFYESFVRLPRGYFHICKKKITWGKQTMESWNYCYYTSWVYIKLSFF